MAARNPRVDAYIAKSAPFARPILSHLRHVVHAACPGVEEEIKWSMPFFVYRGNLCHMAAFKAHCAFGFWRGKEIVDLPNQVGDAGMGNLGRILSLDDLPPKRKLTGFIKTAIRLNEADVKPSRQKSAPKPALAITDECADEFAHALDRHADAAKHFNAFGAGAQRDYLEWIGEAKRADTRASRIATAVEWIAEGKTRHWKYRK